MSKRMLLFDLDGTLLTSNGIVSPLTANRINLCKSNGYHIGYITGRSRSQNMIRLLESLPCDFSAFYNGAMICVGNQLIDSNELPYQQAMHIIKKLKQDYPNLLIDVNQDPWLFYNTCNEIRHSKFGNEKTCHLNSIPPYDIQRIRIRSDNLKYIPLERYMTNESLFYHTIAGDAIIVHKRTNKANAVKIASEYFGISTTHMIAFGDDIGDIDMFKTVGTSVAMGNAIPSLKAVSDYVTETNDNNGIACWINNYLLNKT